MPYFWWIVFAISLKVSKSILCPASCAWWKKLMLIIFVTQFMFLTSCRYVSVGISDLRFFHRFRIINYRLLSDLNLSFKFSRMLSIVLCGLKTGQMYFLQIHTIWSVVSLTHGKNASWILESVFVAICCCWISFLIMLLPHLFLLSQRHRFWDWCVCDCL